jgi:hypothetical protein
MWRYRFSGQKTASQPDKHRKPSASAAVRRAELMSLDPLNAGALAFRRSGDPDLGDFGEPTILKAFGEVPNSLDEL